MNFFVTGGCGFLGVSLVEKLVSDCRIHNIRILDNLSVGTVDALAGVCAFTEILATEVKGAPKGVELIIGDILDEQALLQITKGCDVIAHFAAKTGVGPSVRDPGTDLRVNVLGTFNCLEAARVNGIPRFIFASSGAPVGEVCPPIHEELAAHPVSPYGASKLAGEGYCSAYYRTFGVETVALRFGNVYGPGSLHKSSVVAKFISRALNGEQLEIYGDGTQTRDFIYIDDLICAVCLAAERPDVGGEVFQIASSRETTVSEIVELIVPIMQSLGIEKIRVVNQDAQPGEVKRNFSDTSKAKALLGWSASTELRSGIAKTVEYFLKYYE